MFFRIFALTALVSSGLIVTACGDDNSVVRDNLPGSVPEGVEFGSFVDNRDGEFYATVVIGDQEWMAENLRYIPPKGGSFCYDDDPKNCKKYGRLYTWGAVMDTTGVTCDSDDPECFNCASNRRCYQCGMGTLCFVHTTFRGICPEHWHVPSREEWQRLLGLYATQVKTNYSEYMDYEGVSNSFKDIRSWDKGTNLYGFSVMPAGVWIQRRVFDDTDDPNGYIKWDYFDKGSETYFWTSSERHFEYANAVRFYEYDVVNLLYEDKYNGYSLRCVRDVEPGRVYSLDSSAYSDFDENTAKLVDPRDSSEYRVTAVGPQFWLARNVDIEPEVGESSCYGDSTENCKIYGKLYDWEAAQSVCPPGTHLPSSDEWYSMRQYLENLKEGSSYVASWLRSRDSLWSNSSSARDDFFRFTAKPAGYMNEEGVYKDKGAGAYFWSSTLTDGAVGMYHLGDGCCIDLGQKFSPAAQASVRCVVDAHKDE